MTLTKKEAENRAERRNAVRELLIDGKTRQEIVDQTSYYYLVNSRTVINDIKAINYTPEQIRFFQHL